MAAKDSERRVQPLQGTVFSGTLVANGSGGYTFTGTTSQNLYEGGFVSPFQLMRPAGGDSRGESLSMIKDSFSSIIFLNLKFQEVRVRFYISGVFSQYKTKRLNLTVLH